MPIPFKTLTCNAIKLVFYGYLNFTMLEGGRVLLYILHWEKQRVKNTALYTDNLLITFSLL